MIRVGVNARTFSVSEPGGAVQTAINQTKELEKNDEIDLAILGHDSVAELFPEEELISDYFFRDSQVFGILWERIFLPRLIEKYDIDLLYCPNGNAPLTEIDASVVVCTHDMNALRGMSSPTHRLYRTITLPRGLQLADAIVTVSEFSKSEIERIISVDRSKISVVPNGVSDDYLYSSLESPVDLPDDYILYVGSLNPRKNISGILESYRILRENYGVPHKLVIIGPGNKSIFQDFTIGESSQIVTPGYLTQPELKYAYKNADIFLYPSKYEGFGLPPLEAMTQMTPVVASSAAALPEVLGDCALFPDPDRPEQIAEGVWKVLNDHELKTELTECGEELVEKYSWERAGNRLVNVFTNVEGR
ncbi:hypothetical protein BV210_05805 [Halorientalis sp. IM1011]|uniref:glycosyltransferase family 4 protein n=1 Tax=Halorientalis sp. IM1011 TaxID=1932360 RepID=UPI00097CCD4C|nr:glycosyltransferase family 1 protein [Halorientalis sp. IM1011]AQL42256.1 hypothetical protein BV210_05805 [Halorientalis sp. IM1011]